MQRSTQAPPPSARGCRLQGCVGSGGPPGRTPLLPASRPAPQRSPEAGETQPPCSQLPRAGSSAAWPRLWPDRAAPRDTLEKGTHKCKPQVSRWPRPLLKAQLSAEVLPAGGVPSPGAGEVRPGRPCRCWRELGGRGWGRGPGVPAVFCCPQRLESALLKSRCKMLRNVNWTSGGPLAVSGAAA